MKTVEGMRFRITKLNNALINTKIDNIVEVVKAGETNSEMKDIITNDWFCIDNNNILDCMEIANK